MGKARQPRSSAPSSRAAVREGEVAPSNAELVRLMDSERALGAHGALRSADAIRDSGVLAAFAALENVEVPASERDRSIDHDAVLVKQGLAKLDADQLWQLKQKAYEHEEVAKDLPEAIRKGHYGSERHKQYGALVEELTGGVISAEEAMAMNPTGGIPGPGARELPLAAKIAPIARHAMRHDATGFLLGRFGVGPGYGSKTTVFGRSEDDPLAGQLLGVLREMSTPSEMPATDRVATSGRYA